MPHPDLPGVTPAVPVGARWWNQKVEEYIEWRRANDEISESWLTTSRIVLGGMPRLLRRAGVANPPTSASKLLREHVRLLKACPIWAPTTTAQRLAALRPFLRWSGNRLWEDKALWRPPTGEATRRRWLTNEQLGRLFAVARGRERLLVGLMGYAGLRRCEVLRLRVRDLDLDLASPTMRVLGKGRGGGKWRTVPIGPTVVGVLLETTARISPPDPLYPHHWKTLHRDLAACAERAGIPKLTGHDLRRSFGRIAYYAGAGLVDLQHLYGHESVDMTAYYIGLDEAQARATIGRFEAAMAEAVPGGV